MGGFDILGGGVYFRANGQGRPQKYPQLWKSPKCPLLKGFRVQGLGLSACGRWSEVQFSDVARRVSGLGLILYCFGVRAVWVYSFGFD